ncbi:ATP-binding protein [Litorivicinus sp.]|nr:ATP-binding protein [Litorivicinus sp.]
MKLSLRIKLFLFVPVFVLVPWLGYQTFQKLQHFAAEAQSEALRVVAESLKPELDILSRPETIAGLRIAPEPMRRAPVIDGFFDEWPNIPDALADDRIRLKVGQFDDQIVFALEVKDSTRFYREPLFGRSAAVPFDAVRLRLTGRSSIEEVILAAEASGGFDASVSGDPLLLNSKPRVRAYWWEIYGGYRLEWGMPVSQILSRQIDFIQYDHNWIEPIERQYRFGIEPLNAKVQQLARRLAGETRQIMVVDSDGQVIAKTTAPDEMTSLLVSDAWTRDVTMTEQDIRLNVPLSTETGRYSILIAAPTSEIVGAAQQALVTLAWQTLGVLILLILGLSIYSGRLAERITRLRRELKSYLDTRGRFSSEPALTDARTADEVGELSRDVQQVLRDLARYTAFLERIPRTLRHELSNPMSTVQTSLELLSDEKDPGQQARLRATAERGIQKLESTLAKVTEAASLEEALRDEDQHGFDVARVTRDAVESIQRTVTDRQWRLDAPTDPVVILGNDLRFEQMLDKLLDNARDFTPVGGLITVGVRDHINAVSVWVENTGSSLQVHNRVDAFQMFSGTRNDSTGSHLGLGLYVVRLIAESMGAQVSIGNTERGVRVEVTGLDVP